MRAVLESVQFPVGTLVTVYGGENETQASGHLPPVSLGVTDANVAADRTLTFLGLEPDQEYFAAAQITGVWHWVGFRTAPSNTARFESLDPEDVPTRIDAPAGQTANLFESYVDGVLKLAIDADGQLSLAGIAAGGHELVLAEHMPVNPTSPAYGAIGDGINDDHTAIQSAVSTGRAVYLPQPPVEWHLGDGKELIASNGQLIFGDGRGKTFITCKNGYGIKTPAAGSLVGLCIRDLKVSLRAGSVSGGAIKMSSNSYHSDCAIENCDAIGVAGSADPIVLLDGFIDSHVRNLEATGGQIGVQVSSDGFVSNASDLVNVRVAGNSVAGIRQKSCGKIRILGGVAESNTGDGVQLLGATNPEVKGMWFEDNTGAHVLIDTDGVSATGGARLEDNKYHYHHAGSTAPHIKLAGLAALGGYDNQITGETFQDPPGTGAAEIYVGANIVGTKIGRCRHVGGITHVEEHSEVLYLSNTLNDDYATPNRMLGPIEAAYRPYYGTQRPTLPLRRRAGQTSDFVEYKHEDDATVLAQVTYTGRARFGDGITLKTKAGVISDADFLVAPPNGTMAFDTTNVKLGVRVGGVWKWSPAFV